MVKIQGTSCGVQLTDISPGVPPGSIVLLEGAGFDAARPSANVVDFAASGGGKVTGTVVASGGMHIHVRIPDTATTGDVSVTVNGVTSNALEYQKP
jgi:hypothetical protein